MQNEHYPNLDNLREDVAIGNFIGWALENDVSFGKNLKELDAFTLAKIETHLQSTINFLTGYINEQEQSAVSKKIHRAVALATFGLVEPGKEREEHRDGLIAKRAKHETLLTQVSAEMTLKIKQINDANKQRRESDKLVRKAKVSLVDRVYGGDPRLSSQIVVSESMGNDYREDTGTIYVHPGQSDLEIIAFIDAHAEEAKRLALD